LLDGKIWEWDLSFRREWEWDGNGNEVVEMGRNWYEKSVPAHLYCDIAEIRFVGRHFINKWIECYLNSTITLRPLTPYIMPCYTHKMAIVSWP